VRCGKRRCGWHVVRNCSCNYLRVVCCFYVVDEPVLAAYRTPAGQWSIVAPGCWDLSGRIGVRRIAVLDEPAAGGAEVIKLEAARQERSAGSAGAKPAGG